MEVFSKLRFLFPEHSNLCQLDTYNECMCACMRANAGDQIRNRAEALNVLDLESFAVVSHRASMSAGIQT